MHVRFKSVKNIFFTFLLMMLLQSHCLSHEGVTYPILKEQPLATQPPTQLSIIADPDLDTGSLTFYFKGGIDLKSIVIKTKSTFVQPVNPQLAIIETTAEATHFNDRLVANIPFHTEGEWNILFVVLQNDHLLTQFELPLTVVPPGPSPRQFVLYALPFLILFVVGLRIFFLKRKKLIRRSR